MEISWGKSHLNGDMLFIRNHTVGIYTADEAIKLFPEDAKEILSFIKSTRPEVYRELVVNNPSLVSDEEKTLRETSKVAAKWWADKLRYGTVQNNGEDMQSMMMTLFAMRASKFNGDDINEFERVLAELVDNDIDARGSAYLRVDYHPEGLLRDAAEEANIDVSFKLPVKTSMRVSEEEVTVSEGYGAAEKQLYPKVDKNKKK